jgi:ABC-type Fe3+-hydroxamate transport system substrate-binding protein
MTKGKLSLVLLLVFLMGINLSACSKKAAEEKKTTPKVGPVKMVSHPSTLEGKTVLLRWNGKPNGDLFLTRIGELLVEQVKGVKVVKIWETDKSTAVISDSLEKSQEITEKMANLKPDLVIGAQAD